MVSCRWAQASFTKLCWTRKIVHWEVWSNPLSQRDLHIWQNALFLRNDHRSLLPQSSFSFLFLQGAQGECSGREHTESPCVHLPQAKFPVHSWPGQTRCGELWGPVRLCTKWDSVCICQIKSAGSLYEHSNRFADVKKLKSPVYVCSLIPCKVSMSTFQGLCTQKLSSSALTSLPLHCIKVHILLFYVCMCVRACMHMCAWWVSSQLGAALLPRRHLAMPGDILVRLGWGWGHILLASRG